MTREGMVAGITASQNFLLFLTADVFQSKWVQLEIKEALRLKKHFVLLLEEDEDMMGCARFLPRVDASLSGSGVSIHVAAQLDRSLSASHPRRRLTTSSARSCRLLRLSSSSRNSPALQTSRAVLKVQRVRARQPTWNLCWITLEHTGQQIETMQCARGSVLL